MQFPRRTIRIVGDETLHGIVMHALSWNTATGLIDSSLYRFAGNRVTASQLPFRSFHRTVLYSLGSGLLLTLPSFNNSHRFLTLLNDGEVEARFNSTDTESNQAENLQVLWPAWNSLYESRFSFYVRDVISFLFTSSF